MRWAGHIAHTGKIIAYRVLMGNREEKKPLGTLGLKCEDNIKMDVKRDRMR
jgi:hypothetical protein